MHTFFLRYSPGMHVFASVVSNISEGRAPVCQSVSVWKWRTSQQTERLITHTYTHFHVPLIAYGDFKDQSEIQCDVITTCVSFLEICDSK